MDIPNPVEMQTIRNFNSIARWALEVTILYNLINANTDAISFTVKYVPKKIKDNIKIKFARDMWDVVFTDDCENDTTNVLVMPIKIEKEKKDSLYLNGLFPPK